MPDATRKVNVVDYDPGWAEAFRTYAATLRAALGDLIIGIEHVGSTSVVGLAAKPVVDMDVVISLRLVLGEVIERLAELGYGHRGDLGIPGREAFAWPGRVRHHLYVCSVDTPNLHQHLIFRDYLRRHPDVAEAYGALKRELASRYTYDIDAYLEAKTAFIQDVTERAVAVSLGSE